MWGGPFFLWNQGRCQDFTVGQNILGVPGYPPSPHTQRCGQTENITFPHPSDAVGKKLEGLPKVLKTTYFHTGKQLCDSVELPKRLVSGYACLFEIFDDLFWHFMFCEERSRMNVDPISPESPM